jgi:hypothetical protein
MIQLWLLSNPNHDSALNSVCKQSDEKTYEKFVKTTSLGMIINGKKYSNISSSKIGNFETITLQHKKISRFEYKTRCLHYFLNYQ